MKQYVRNVILPLIVFSLLAVPSYATRKKIDYRQLLNDFVQMERYEQIQEGGSLPNGLMYKRSQKASDAKKERKGAFNTVKKQIGREIDRSLPKGHIFNIPEKIAKEVINRSVQIDEGKVKLGKLGNVFELGANVLMDEGKNFAADIIVDVDTNSKFLNGVLKEVGSSIKTSRVSIKDGKIRPRLAYRKSVKDIDCGFAKLGVDGGLVYDNGLRESLGLNIDQSFGPYSVGVRNSFRYNKENGFEYDGASIGVTRRDKKITLDSRASIRKRAGKFEGDVKINIRF